MTNPIDTEHERRKEKIEDRMISDAEDRAAEETGKGKKVYTVACIISDLPHNWANLTSREQLSWVQFAKTGRGL